MAIAETISEHHLGQTIVKEANKRDLSLEGELLDGEVIKGNGIRAQVDGYVLAIGNRKLMEAENIQIGDAVSAYALKREKAGNTAIFAAVDGQVAGIFSIADQIREDAHRALAELRKNGINKMVMLTGDNRHTAELVANELGLDEFQAELLPENKVEYVKQLKAAGQVVAMAGMGSMTRRLPPRI